jgi:hypothetical protein
MDGIRKQASDHLTAWDDVSRHRLREEAESRGVVGIAELVWAGAGLSRRDWTRALLATEFVWARDVLGAGLDSVYTFGFSEAEAIQILRSVQGIGALVESPPRDLAQSLDSHGPCVAVC